MRMGRDAAAGDIPRFVRGGILALKPVARHLWRICFGLFVAPGSFFMGRQRIFLDLIQKSKVLIFLTILPLDLARAKRIP